MKKISILLFSLGTITTVFAQTDHNDRRMNEAKSVVLGRSNDKDDHDRYEKDDHNKSGSSSDYKRRNEEIQRINREYDVKIQAVKRDRHLRTAERNRKIHLLEKQRDEQIRFINQHDAKRSVAYDNHYDKNKNRH